MRPLRSMHLNGMIFFICIEKYQIGFDTISIEIASQFAIFLLFKRSIIKYIQLILLFSTLK